MLGLHKVDKTFCLSKILLKRVNFQALAVWKVWLISKSNTLMHKNGNLDNYIRGVAIK